MKLGRIKRVSVVSLGCSKNLVDSEQLLHQLTVAGFEVEHNGTVRRGDAVVVNTCGFIQDAKEESVETILNYAKARSEGKIAALFVMGCLSQRYFYELQQEIPEVDGFYGKFNWPSILEALGKRFDEKTKNHRCLTTPSHYAYLKISEGCNRNCAFCAIPLITGKHRSRRMEDIEEEVRLLVDRGVKELQLIAQDLSYYGRDLYHQAALPELVERIANVSGIEWIRLHYTYPYQFPMDLLRVMREKKNVCAYLDMALQHCSDNMLQRMHRHIDQEETYRLIEQIRQEVPGIHLRTTLMTGFPGETESDFEALKEFVRRVRFERMGAFAYSDEEGTYAHLHYEDNVPQEVKDKRLEELMTIQQVISEEINQEKVGKCFRVIIDREEDDYYIGRTEYDSPEVDPEVLISKSTHLNIGTFYQVRITEAESYDLYGTVIH